MNRDVLQGQWNKLKGTVRSKWAKLTDDDVELAQGKFESLVGALQKRYGLARDKAEQEIDDFIGGIDNSDRPS